ncbi:MAG TPA: hypothetical protein VGC72_04470 [Candidatus Elarobacter sp.]|jgi:hypothetical protein
MRTTLVYAGIVVGAVLLASAVSRTPAPARGSVPIAAHVSEQCPNPAPVPAALRLPASVPPGEPTAIEKTMLRYLYGDDPDRVPSSSPNLYPYRRLGWCVDKYVRDTGPYVHGQYYGTHPAVRIYYSPEVMTWLRNGRRGVPADGAVIIKEQYNPAPAARYEGLSDAQLQPHDWTVMIRRTGASHDGWFWAEVFTKTADNKPMSFGGTQYPNAGFGLYCLRCHGSANDASTFAALDNIKGFAGEPLTFKIDDTWRTSPKQIDREHEKNAQLATQRPVAAIPPGIQRFPDEPLDTMLAHPKGPPQFMTSDQCMGCHGAASGPPSGPLMWLTPPPSYTPPPSPPPGAVGVNVSEYGEWRWSPMGLAGRDPVFFSQLESEQQFIDAIPDREIAGDHPAQTRATLKQQVVDTCMRCHGVMGKRQNEIDHGRNAHFDEKWVFAADPAKPSFHYGGLARDGISCTVCHHITQPPNESLAFVLQHKNTGLFDVGPADKLHGPFETKTIAAHPMKTALGATPVFGALTKSARLCASCHSINLPVVDSPAKIHPITTTMAHDVEQNTYVEWVNSKFQTEYKPGAGAKSCQDCHMAPSVSNARLGVTDPEIQTRIALSQDETYPAAEHRAPLDGIEVRYRKHGFRRHELLGLNAFLLRTFQAKPNDDVLGVRLADYMSGSTTDLDDAIGNVVRQARESTARLDVDAKVAGGTVIANVGVLNLTGHRMPSGVGFRRAWIELKLVDANGKPVWVSGSTNHDGEIVDVADRGTVLPTEYFTRGSDGKQRYQPHFDEQHPITRSDQVQIFEELTLDKSGTITESFIRRDHHLKDNRLLPQGWRKNGPPGITLPSNWLEATRPKGAYVTSDPRYADGKGRAVVTYRIPLPAGSDASHLRVEATLWSQSWEPSFKRERTHGNGPAATRLRFLLSNLDLNGTALADWKLQIASASTATLR